MNAAALIASRTALVFDLDGTLADTVADLWLALNAALQDCGLATVEEELVRGSLHGGLEGTARAAINRLQAQEGALWAVREAYARRYRERAHSSSALYAGVRQLLDGCAERHALMAVCTNKTRAEALTLLERLGIANRFSCVIGGDSTPLPKPHPAPLLRVLQELGAQAHESLLIGDSHVDAQCAQRAGVDFIFHEAGYGSPDGARHPVAARFRSYRELVKAF